MRVPQIPQGGLGRSQSGSGNGSVDVNADGTTPGIRSCVTLQMRPFFPVISSGLFSVMDLRCFLSIVAH